MVCAACPRSFARLFTRLGLGFLGHLGRKEEGGGREGKTPRRGRYAVVSSEREVQRSPVVWPRSSLAALTNPGWGG